MKLTILYLSVIALGLAGCQPSREQMLVGTWTGQGADIIINQDKTFKAQQGPQTLEGKWTLAEDTVSLNVEKVGGKPKAEMQKMLDDQIKKMKPAEVEQFAPMIQSTMVLLNDWKLAFSDDGKSLTTVLMGQTVSFTKKS